MIERAIAPNGEEDAGELACESDGGDVFATSHLNLGGPDHERVIATKALD